MSDYFGTYEYESGMLRHGKPMDGDGGVFYLPHQCDEWEIGGVDQLRQLISDAQQTPAGAGGRR